MCSGSGDAVVRFWDLETFTPDKVGQGSHSSWVLSLSWSPDGKFIASGGMDNLICVWQAISRDLERTLNGHMGWITSLSWEPCHIEYPCRRLLSGSKDGTLRIWDILVKKCVNILTGHTKTVKSVRWGGEGRIFSGSADGTIKIWSSFDGQLLTTLTSHGHWVNTITLSTDYLLRTGIYDHNNRFMTSLLKPLKNRAKVLSRYNIATLGHPERLATGSDDFTMFLWTSNRYKVSKIRLTGHQQPINHVCFSPNGIWLISASFDKSIKLWNGMTGQLVAIYLGHVASVYMCAWSLDSRLFVSISKDSSLRVWDICQKKIMRVY